MHTQQSFFEEDHIPTGGAGFKHIEPVTADEVFDILSARTVYDRNGRDFDYWFNEIIINSNLAELPIVVVAELIHNAAAHRDGSHKHMRYYLSDIIRRLM